MYSDSLAGNLSFFLFGRFIRLASVIISYLLLESFTYAGRVQMLEDHRVYYIHSWMKEILVVTI